MQEHGWRATTHVIVGAWRSLRAAEIISRVPHSHRQNEHELKSALAARLVDL